MRILAYGFILASASVAFAGCSGGQVTLQPLGSHVTPTPGPGATATSTAIATATPTAKATATPTIVATATATPSPTNAPNSVATTAAVNNGMALSNAPLSTAAPAPTGYTQSLSIPIVNAPANTTATFKEGTTVPSTLVPLSRSRGHFERVRDAASGAYDTIFYDSIQPSADITVAGNISFTQSFPNGGLTAGTQYYLAFYDTTQASPAWQTIAGPVTANGNDLTFSGTVSSITLAANRVYGFATFSTVTPSATPPPPAQTLLYFGNSTALTVADESGNVQSTLAIPSQSFDLDDAGNVYAFDDHHGGPSPGMGGSPQLAKYAPGSSTVAALYSPSVADNIFVSSSGSGEVAAVHFVSAQGTLTTDVWDQGVTGAPSRTIVTSVPTGIVTFAQTHDGTLYLPDRSSAGVPQFDVISPGASTPSRTIPETIVPSSQYANFAPNYTAVGPDGTLYVTEYNFAQPDPNAGLYIYPVTGAERFIATASDANGPGPQGVDVDASGNIYVVNNNTAVTSNTTCQGDSLQSVSVYSPSGTLLRTITNSNLTGFPVTTAADGTSFVSSFAVQLMQSCAVSGDYGIFSIAPGASTMTQISTSGSTEIVLYDGTHKTEPFSRSYRGGSAGSGMAARGGPTLRRTIRR